MLSNAKTVSRPDSACTLHIAHTHARKKNRKYNSQVNSFEPQNSHIDVLNLVFHAGHDKKDPE